MADGFVLPLEAAASSEPQTIPPLPGLWTPDVPVHPDTLGMTHEEVTVAVADWGLPLEAAQAEQPPADFKDEHGGMVSGAEAESSLPTGRPREASDVPGLTPAEVADRDVYDEFIAAQGGPVAQQGMNAPPVVDGDTPPEPLPPATADEALNALTVAQLRDLADSNSVDLLDATSKADIVEVLKAAGVTPGSDG